MNLHQLQDGKNVIKPAGNVVFSDRVDVLVSGLGTAGAFCAMAAAKDGARVLGIERSGCCGGMCTLGAVNGYYYGAKGGMFETVDQESNALTNVYQPFGSFHPDAKKAVMEKHLLDYGVKIAYHAVITGIYEENGAVLGVQVKVKDELRNIGCTVLVDGTSEGHLIRMYGVPTGFGRRTDLKAQPFTSVRVFLNEKGRLSRTNFDSGYVNQYDDEELSKAILHAHSHHVTALQGSERFLYAAPLIGVREGVHFDGEETLTLEDILEGKSFEKTMLYAYSDIDKHGKDLAFDERTYQDWFMVSNLSTVAVRIPVPLGSVVPKGVTGFISTGRCLSMDSYAAAAVRMNRDMHRIGEACGVAAAMALQTGGKVMDIDYALLQEKLRAQNCFDPAPERKLGFGFPGKWEDYTPVQWLTDAGEIRAVLSTDKPGVAIWSCRRLGSEKIGDALVEFMQDKDDMLRKNAAVALGITGDKRALPVLREIVRERDHFFFKDCRRTNQLRSAIAVCLCGRLEDKESLPELYALLSAEEFDRPCYHALKEYSYQFGIDPKFNLVYFQHLSNAAAALVRIAEAHEEVREEIASRLSSALEDLDYIARITPDAEDTANYKAAKHIWEYACTRLPVPVL